MYPVLYFVIIDIFSIQLEVDGLVFSVQFQTDHIASLSGIVGMWLLGSLGTCEILHLSVGLIV